MVSVLNQINWSLLDDSHLFLPWRVWVQHRVYCSCVWRCRCWCSTNLSSWNCGQSSGWACTIEINSGESSFLCNSKVWLLPKNNRTWHIEHTLFMISTYAPTNWTLCTMKNDFHRKWSIVIRSVKYSVLRTSVCDVNAHVGRLNSVELGRDEVCFGGTKPTDSGVRFVDQCVDNVLFLISKAFPWDDTRM